MPEKMPFFDWGGGSITFEADSVRNPNAFVSYLESEMRRLGIQPRVFLPKKGDMLIWHGYLAHAGTPIKDQHRTRKSLVTHYTSNARIIRITGSRTQIKRASFTKRMAVCFTACRGPWTGSCCRHGRTARSCPNQDF